jgi:hypothetical protein
MRALRASDRALYDAVAAAAPALVLGAGLPGPGVARLASQFGALCELRLPGQPTWPTAQDCLTDEVRVRVHGLEAVLTQRRRCCRWRRPHRYC